MYGTHAHREAAKARKQTKMWIITYYDPEGKAVGPDWVAESKIKPTRWAKAQTETYIPTFSIRQGSDEEYRKWLDGE